MILTPYSMSSVSDYLAKTDPTIMQSSREKEIVDRVNLGYQVIVDGVLLIDVKSYDVPKLLQLGTYVINENARQIIFNTEYQKRIRGRLHIDYPPFESRNALK
ncbi:MAG: hypothetical protein IJO13_00380 [Lachnospiraceae bacterium]|nr:hypothetical protein [Lachnospiraceae bacterium]